MRLARHKGPFKLRASWDEAAFGDARAFRQFLAWLMGLKHNRAKPTPGYLILERLEAGLAGDEVPHDGTRFRYASGSDATAFPAEQRRRMSF